MGLSPDSGGRVGLGRPLQPDYFELQTTAAEGAVLKEGLGLVPNTLDVSFAQLGGNLWKYQASSSKPMIPLYVLKGITHPDEEKPSALLQKNLKKVFEEVPIKIREKLKEDYEKEPEERDPFWVAVEQILRFSGKALAWLELVQDINPQGFLENSSKLKDLKNLALLHWIEIALETVDIIDHERTFHSSVKKANKEYLGSLILLSRRLLDAEKKKQAALALVLLQEVSVFQRYHQQNKLDNALGTTTALINALYPIAYQWASQAASQQECGMFYGYAQLKLLFGKNHHKVLSGYAEFYVDSPFQQETLSNMCGLVSLVMTAMILEATGLENDVQNSQVILDKLDTVKDLLFQLASSLITASDFSLYVSENFVEYSGLVEDTANTGLSEAISFLSKQEWILAASRGNRFISSPSSLLRGMRNALFEELLAMKTHPSLEGMTAIGLSQAILALKNRSSVGYFEAIKILLNHAEIKKEDLQYETQKNIDACAIVINASHHDVDKENQAITIMSQSA